MAVTKISSRIRKSIPRQSTDSIAISGVNSSDPNTAIDNMTITTTPSANANVIDSPSQVRMKEMIQRQKEQIKDDADFFINLKKRTEIMMKSSFDKR